MLGCVENFNGSTAASLEHNTKCFKNCFFYRIQQFHTIPTKQGIPAPSSSSSTNLSEYHRRSTSSCSVLSHRNATTQTLNTPCPRVPLKLFLTLFEFVLVRWSDRTEATKYLWSWMAETVVQDKSYRKLLCIFGLSLSGKILSSMISVMVLALV